MDGSLDELPNTRRRCAGTAFAVPYAFGCTGYRWPERRIMLLVVGPPNRAVRDVLPVPPSLDRLPHLHGRNFGRFQTRP